MTRTKTKKVKLLNIPNICHYCGGIVKLASAKVIYGERGEGNIYLCSNCNACVGVFPGTNRPKGVLANSALRNKRVITHLVFDDFYKQAKMSRTEAYKWLAVTMNLPKRLAHIGQFEMDKCEELIRLCKKQQKIMEVNHEKHSSIITDANKANEAA